MAAHSVQFRQQIAQTRATTTAKLELLEQHVSRRVAETMEQTVVVPMRGLQVTVTRSTTVLHQKPWLIIAAGALLGYQLNRANGRSTPLAMPVPERAQETSLVQSLGPTHMIPAVYDSPQPPPAPWGARPMPEEPPRAAPRTHARHHGSSVGWV
jgi:hypothetical protein